MSGRAQTPSGFIPALPGTIFAVTGEEGILELVVRARPAGGGVVVDVGGEIDLSTAPALLERLTGVIDEGHSRIVLDLAHVGFMDSTGLGTLVGALKRVKERGGELSLVGAGRPVQRLLSITGLDRVFTMFGTVDEALSE